MIIHPRPSPIAASMYQLRDLGVDAIILHGPSGCCFRTARLLEQDGVKVFTTGMNEDDFIFGGSNKLLETVNEVIKILKKKYSKKNNVQNINSKNNKKYLIGIVGSCPSMIIGENLSLPVEECSYDDVVIIPVEVHGGSGDNTVGAIKVMESAFKYNLIDKEEYDRQIKILSGATEVEKSRGMAKNKYIPPSYRDDTKEVIKLLKNLPKDSKIACVLNAKKETAYLFADTLISINRHFKDYNIINIANLDHNVGLPKIRKDCENIIKEYSKNNIKIDYITGGLDEYGILGDKVINILKNLELDIIIVSGVPHGVPIDKMEEKIIKIGISDGPRTFYSIKEMYDYGIIEYDAHAKVLGKREVVKSKFGEILDCVFDE